MSSHKANEFLDELLTSIEAGVAREALYKGVEFKSAWDRDYGCDICALANSENSGTSYLVVGVSDKGIPVNHNEGWLAKTEQQIANHILEFLAPTWCAKHYGKKTSKGHIIIIEINNPGDVVEWDGRAYKLVGTSSREMTPDESLMLSLRLPGQDISKTKWSGEVHGSLVLEFAEKIKKNGSTALPADLSSMAPNEILQKLNTADKKAAGILFGDCTVRIVFYDNSGDVISQSKKQGAFHLLSDDFVEQLQTWTRARGTLLQGQSLASIEELPYPPKALREALANAVAHSLYERDCGDIIVDVYPERLVIRNNCLLESKELAKQWFSKQTYSRNKFLMRLLREAGLTDELGSGKIRLFSQMIEHGRREPIIEFYEKGKIGSWVVTLYNEEQNNTYLALLNKFKSCFDTIDEARIAMALVLWSNSDWPSILDKLDEHYKKLAVSVIENTNSPVIIVNGSILKKRWVNAILAGQQSMAFTAAEEEQIKAVIQKIAFQNNRNGSFSTNEARQIIGLSTSKSEIVQLSNLFRKWKQRDIIRQGKRGHWVFQKNASHEFEIIMSLLEKYKKDQPE